MSHAPRPARALAALALLLTLAPTVARAAIDAKARPVVERYVQVTGGAAAYAGVRSSYSRSTIEAFGFKGKAESWRIPPDREASSVELGPFHIQTGFDGTTGWRKDAGGQLLMLDGKDLEDVKSSAWFSNDQWLRPDQGGGRVSYLGEEKDSTGTYTVLEVAPPVGRSRKLYFDTTTGFIARVISVRDVQTTFVTFSKYRPAGPLTIPFESVQGVVGMPANTLTQRVDSVDFESEITMDPFRPPGQVGPAIAWLKRPGRAELPFEYRGRHVWLRASVNGGPPADFIFDTGASMSVIDSAYAVRIGLQREGTMTGQGAAGAGGASFAKLDSLRIESADGDGITVSGLQTAVLSINSTLAPFFWRDCAGIIGFNVIGLFVDRIDYDARQLTLMDPKTFRYAGAGAKVPFRLATFIPVIPMTVDGHAGEFRLDVGSSSTVDLHAPFVAEHRLLTKPKRTLQALGGGFGGTFTTTMGRLSSMSLGPYTWKEPLVAMHTGDQGFFASSDYAGNVGNQILERFTVTLDYERREAWFEPSKLVAKRDAVSRFGAQLVLVDGVVRPGQVLRGSAAEAAGLRDTDEIVSVDGRPVLELGPDAVNRLFEERPAGAKVPLEVRRDGKVVKLVATLKDVL